MKEHISAKSIKFSNEILLGSIVDLVKLGKKVKMNISGSSMQPFLYDGDMLILGKVKLKDIKLGDIILGRYGNSYVLHRVIQIKKDCVYIAGDNNLSQIERIEADEIQALALKVIGRKGNLNLLTKTSRLKGLIWYYLRPFRRVYTKLFK